MGIKNMMTIVKRYAPSSLKYTTINNYKNKILGIDANLMIYKMIFAIRRNGYDIMKGKIKVTHIHALIDKLVAFRKYNITPIFVFDGKHPTFKQQTMDKRKEHQKTMKKKYTQAKTKENKKKYYYMKTGITEQELNDCKKLISSFGYMWLKASGEADSQLAYMSKQKMVDAIVSDDMDILIFGGTVLLKNFSVSTNKQIQEIKLKQLLKGLKMTQTQLIHVGMILGCDYCDNLKGIGPIKAVSLIKEGGKPEMKNSELVFNYFQKPPVIKQLPIYHKTNKSIDYISLKKFLLTKGYTNDKLIAIAEKLS